MYDYCNEHDGIIRVYDDSCEYPTRPLCKTREEFEANIFAEPEMRPSYYIYLSKIRDAVIFGYEDLLYAEDCCLTDRKKQIQGNHYYISGNIPEIGAETALVKVPKNPEVIERGIDLVKMWSNNYYHFTFEVLARLQLVDAVEEYRTWPLIVDEGALRNAWNVQLLAMVNTYNHPVITVQHGKSYIVREMIYPSFLNWSGEIHLGYSPRMHTKAAGYLHECVAEKHKPSRKYRNIYVARGNNDRLTNESEVMKCLTHYGFEIIPQGAEDYSRTLDAFMTADNIIGTMGANMSNTMASKPEANIYVICPFEYHYDNPGIAVTDSSRRKLHFIAAYVQHRGKLLNQSTFSIDIHKLEALAQNLSR